MFNIGRNDFRLVVEIVYVSHKVYIRFVGTHQGYDRGRWKATAWVVSGVLAGKRSLTTDHVRGLASFFGLPADLFLRETAAA